MDIQERQKFWDVLKTLTDASQESLNKINKVYKIPKNLCRFRTVNESSLLQLQNNKLYFSSSNYYDDPFDTYFYINYESIQRNAEYLGCLIHGDNNLAKKTIEQIVPSVDPDLLLNTLLSSNFNIEVLKNQFLEIRELIQKQIYSICFCEDYKNETLWLKYADNHKGFVQVYDFWDKETFLCGKEAICEQCPMEKPHPNIYPVNYTDQRYDATKFALGILLQKNFPPEIKEKESFFKRFIESSLQWETERISLTKKMCHHYDEEWRMICPLHAITRPCIKMKPKFLVLGLRMANFEKRLVISAAQEAGIFEIKEMYINENDQLDVRNIN